MVRQPEVFQEVHWGGLGAAVSVTDTPLWSGHVSLKIAQCYRHLSRVLVCLHMASAAARGVVVQCRDHCSPAFSDAVRPGPPCLCAWNAGGASFSTSVHAWLPCLHASHCWSFMSQHFKCTSSCHCCDQAVWCSTSVVHPAAMLPRREPPPLCARHVLCSACLMLTL